MSGPQDVLLKCGDCGKDFPWTGREQEFFRERDFPPPKRCKECRQANQQRFGGQKAGEGRGDGGVQK
ncbi:MAG TPA: zinc-ribbon domain containing protein [Pyrinomonadaceae bacterium]